MTVRTASGQSRPASLERTALVRRLPDRASVRERLKAARSYAAYAVAYLDPRLFPLASFYEATSGSRWALVMHARGGLGTSTLTLGDAGIVEALMRLHPAPRQTFLTCDPTHVDGLLIGHNLWRPQTMLRMQVDRGSFAAKGNAASVRRLIAPDAPDLNALYAIEGDGLRYSGRQISQGMYFGAYVRGRLVSAAGTHIYSNSEGIGVVGNVFTHPDHRGHGLGTAVTSAVTAQLLRTCDLVVLNVDPANRTARHIYEELGYREAGRLVEAMATRRHALSPLPLLRRLVGRWRSSAPGVESIVL
jgi:ribosomal protein S18 acetylase RimI-like enzyme